jgi:hypothetical protein
MTIAADTQGRSLNLDDHRLQRLRRSARHRAGRRTHAERDRIGTLHDHPIEIRHGEAPVGTVRGGCGETGDEEDE